MNAGFSNLATLKAHLLTAELRALTDFNTQITALGLGVAAQFEKYCNRKFMRSAGATMTFPADNDHVILDRYPVEAVTKVEIKENSTDGFVEEANAIENWDAASGWLTFGAPLSTNLAVGRVTFTGGYFWEQLESTDQGYPTAVPAGSTAIPDDLKYAWLLQCKAAWDSQDRLGTGIAEKPGERSKLGELDLLPAVKLTLAGYIRMALV